MATQKRYEFLLVGIMFFTWGALYLDRMTVLFIAPYIAPDLHLSSLQIGQLAAVLSVTWAISSLLFGLLSDRVGRRRVLIPMIFFFSMMSFFSGLAQNFGQLLVARALMGFAEGPCWSIMNSIVERSSTPQTRARNVGLVLSAASLVGLAVTPIISTQIATHYGWRWAFMVAGAPGLIGGILVWLFVKEPSRQNDDGVVEHVMQLRDLPSLVGTRNILLCSLAAAGFIWWLVLQTIFGPIFITQVMHESGTTAGFLLGAAGLGSFIIGSAGPGFATRFGKRQVLIVFAAASFFLPLAIIYPPLYAHLWLLAGILFCTQGALAISALVMVLIPTASVPVRLSASAIGLVTMVGELIGSTVAPVLAGNLVPTYGLAFPLELSAAGMVPVILAALFLKERRVPAVNLTAVAAE
jgi:predicted MFS family arabinose efflux permease